MKIPLVDLKAQYRTISSDIDQAIQRVINNTSFIMGQEVEAFESAFAAYCQAKYAIGVASGTAALHLALRACDVGPGHEVITTPYTFIATAEAITHAGARPVFVDIDPLTYNIDPAEIEAAITERTRAIIPVHLYGQPADMDPILEIAQRHGLRVIEDAAQAHDAEYKGRRVGTLGDVACFSFYPGKNLGAYGDAGAVVTNDPQIADRVRLLRNHGRRQKYEHLIEGYGERLDALQGAILSAKLPYLGSWTNARRKLADHYRAHLADSDNIIVPFVADDVRHVYHLFVVQVPSRDQVLSALRADGIGAGVHYPIPLHLQPAYRYIGAEAGSFPVAEACASKVLSLPLYPEMTEEQVTWVSERVRFHVSRINRNGKHTF